MNGKLIFAGAALALLAPALHAQTAPLVTAAPAPSAVPSGPAVTLRYKFAVGQVRRYEYDEQTDMLTDTGKAGAGIPINITMQKTMRQTVKSIRATDGAATIITQIETVRVLHNGKEVPLSEEQRAKIKQPITQVVLPNGKVFSVQAPISGSAGVPGMGFSKGASGSLGSTVALPEGRTRIGDTWDTTGSFPGLGVDLASKSTLASLDQKNGTTLATIETKQTGMTDKAFAGETPMKMQGQITGEVFQVFDMSAGVLQSMKGSCSSDLLMTAEKSADGIAPPELPFATKMQTHIKYTMRLLPGSTLVSPSVSAAAPAH